MAGPDDDEAQRADGAINEALGTDYEVLDTGEEND